MVLVFFADFTIAVTLTEDLAICSSPVHVSEFYWKALSHPSSTPSSKKAGAWNMSTANVPFERAHTLNFSEACTRHGSAENTSCIIFGFSDPTCCLAVSQNEWNLIGTAFYSQYLHLSPHVSVQEMLFIFFTSIFTTAIELEGCIWQKMKNCIDKWMNWARVSACLRCFCSQSIARSILKCREYTCEHKEGTHVVRLSNHWEPCRVMRFCLCSWINSPGKATVGNTSRIRDVSLPRFGIFELMLSVCFPLYLSVSALQKSCILNHIHAYWILSHSQSLCQDSHRVENAADHAFRTAKHLEEAH